MTAKNRTNRKPQAGLLTRAAMLPRLIAVLTAVCALTGSATAQTSGQQQERPRPTSSDNPYAQSTQIPAIPGNTLQTPGSALLGIQTTVGNLGNAAPSTALLYPDSTTYVLSAGDLINVRLYAAPDYISTVRISKDGTVQLPLIGVVNLAGITIHQGEDLIASALKTAGMYIHPEVIIGLAESSAPQTVAFAGEKGGIYLLQGQRSLLDVIAGSGGLPIGSSRTLSIIRPGLEAPIVVNLGNTPQDLVKANIPVFPRDTIFVERAGSVYLLGAFRQPGIYPMQATGVSLMQAATLAGGPTYAGKYSDLRIIRTVGTERTEVKVDIKRVMFGHDPDPILQPGDIVFLPTQALKAALAAGGLSALLSAASILTIATVQR